MARAFPSAPAEIGDAPQSDDWQALRGELVALLDQVEGQYVSRAGQDPAYAGFAQRMRDLRHKVADTRPEDRRREALRSVKRQVDRFSERAETDSPAPEMALQSAIREIRARTRPELAARPPVTPPPAPRYAMREEVAGSLSDLDGRLGRLEAALAARTDGSTQVREIADHLAQLTQMVEMLADAVGDSGQVKRLEAQIASLAELISHGAQADIGQLTDRIDQVAATLDRLADLQVQQIRHAVEAEAGSARDEAQIRGLSAVEETLRHVYDRMDALEHNVAMPATELERLGAMLAEIGSRIGEPGDSAVQQDRLIGLIDALNGRVGAMESRHAGVEALKADIDELRDAMLDAVEPRFQDIQQRLGDIKDRLAIRAADPPGVSQLEAQIRQLVARMDQSAEQLAHIAEMRAEPTPALPDMEALADMVASRTTSALARQPAALLSEASLSEIEARIGRLVEGFLQAQPPMAQGSAPGSGSGAQDELDRIEEKLKALDSIAARSMPAPSAMESRGAALERAAAARERQAKPPRSAAVSDAMPRNPAEEAPLTDPGFADGGPVRAALAARTDAPAATGIAVSPPAVKEADAPAGGTQGASGRPSFDPASVPLPPRPRSSLDDAPQVPFNKPMPAPEEEPRPVAPSTRNTFIEAARRAAQRQQAAATPAGADSPIGRALARFQRDAGADPAKPDARHAGEDEAPAKRRRGLFRRKPAASDEEAGDEGDDAQLAPPVEAEARAERQESFLVRHRRPLLIGASLIAVSFMALNLVMQRMAEHAQHAAPASATAAPAAAPAAPVAPAVPTIPAAASPTAALKPASLVLPLAPHPAAETPITTVPPQATDAMTTAAIDPGAALSYAPAIAPLPPALAAANSAAGASPAEPAAAVPQPAIAQPAPVSGASATSAVASISPTPLESPVKLALPPAALGPLALRQAAANGDARAQFEVAAIYSEGHAVPQDMAEAAAWYERAAAQGFVPAQYRLGNLYELGQGVSKDLDQARLWYQRAAEAGNRMAMHNLAALYAGGQFGKQDFAQAANWFEQAAQRGMKDSQFNLGMLYARGLGVKQDLAASYKWFALAAATGDAEAGKSRDNIARSLDAETLNKAEADVAAWKPTPIDLSVNFAPIGTWQKNFDPGPAIADKDVVTKVQQALGRLGYDVGTPTGKVGPKTSQAIKAFEHATGMSEVGAINPRLLAVLGSQPV